MNNRESHCFPTGLTVTYYSNLEDAYLQDRNAVRTQADLLALQQKWRYLAPEVNHPHVEAETLLALVASDDMQREMAQRANTDLLAHCYLNLLLPSVLLEAMIKGQRYGVNSGTVILQIWNAGGFHETEDGTWIRQEPAQPRESSDDQHHV